MFNTLFNLLFNREKIKQQDEVFLNKDVIIYTDLNDNKLYTAYLSVWSFKTYFIILYSNIVLSLKHMRVGTIFKSLLFIPQSVVYSLHQVNYNLEHLRMNMVDAYEVLTSPTSYK